MQIPLMFLVFEGVSRVTPVIYARASVIRLIFGAVPNITRARPMQRECLLFPKESSCIAEASASLDGGCVNRTELIEAISSDTGLNRQQSETALDALVYEVTAGVRSGEPVRITGFGTFKLRERKARLGRNPQTGQAVRIRASNSIGFTPGVQLKNDLNSTGALSKPEAPVARAAAPAKKAGAKKASAKKAATKRTAAKKTAAKKTTAKKAAVRKTAAKKTTARKTAAKKTTARKTTARKTTARKSPAKKTTARKSAAKKTTARKTAAKKTTARKTAAKKTTARKTTARKSAAKKTTARKTAAKKTTARKTTARKTAAKKTTARKTAAKRTAAKSTARKAPARKRAAKRGARSR
jgi:DNA-binding protein HU-beta